MMKIPEESERLILDPGKDRCLFRAPREARPSGHKVFRGTDLYVHESTPHKEIFYTLRWAQKPKKLVRIVPIGARMAERFLETRGLICTDMDPKDRQAIETLTRYGWGILEEF